MTLLFGSIWLFGVTKTLEIAHKNKHVSKFNKFEYIALWLMALIWPIMFFVFLVTQLKKRKHGTR